MLELLKFVSTLSEFDTVAFSSKDFGDLLFQSGGLYWDDIEKELRTYEIIFLIEENVQFTLKNPF